MSRTISVTRALAELKNLDDRIKRDSTQAFVMRTVGKDSQRKIVSANLSVEEAERQLKANLQSVQALIQNRQNLKGKIVMSNANTQVTVGNRTMSIAEAIELKQSVENQKNLLANLRHQLTSNTNEVDRNNVALDEAISKLVTTVYGADKAKITEDVFKAVADPQKNAKEQTLLDPNKVQDVIKALEAEVQSVETELNFILSESNARTNVIVDF